ncbi:MAG: GNAT family N-acetyltransferase [Caulobacterales bacterium]
MLVRAAHLPDDAGAIAALDTSFTTDEVFDVETAQAGFTLNARRLAQPLTKRFALDDLDDPKRPWSDGFLAEAHGECLGFAAAGYEPWNRRVILWHLYVDPKGRRQGIARALADEVARLGKALGGRELWLETSNLNVPGVAAYRAMGFSLTGLDLTLYEGTPAEGEIALFFSRQIG